MRPAGKHDRAAAEVRDEKPTVDGREPREPAHEPKEQRRHRHREHELRERVGHGRGPAQPPHQHVAREHEEEERRREREEMGERLHGVGGILRGGASAPAHPAEPDHRLEFSCRRLHGPGPPTREAARAPTPPSTVHVPRHEPCVLQPGLPCAPRHRHRGRGDATHARAPRVRPADRRCVGQARRDLQARSPARGACCLRRRSWGTGCRTSRSCPTTLDTLRRKMRKLDDAKLRDFAVKPNHVVHPDTAPVEGVLLLYRGDEQPAGGRRATGPARRHGVRARRARRAAARRRESADARRRDARGRCDLRLEPAVGRDDALRRSRTSSS